jgi:hypothetical protein
MTALSKLPNLANSFALLKLGLDLRNATINGSSLIEISIQKAFIDKKCTRSIITWVQSQINDNPVLMGQLIGEELTLRILKFDTNE